MKFTGILKLLVPLALALTACMTPATTPTASTPEQPTYVRLTYAFTVNTSGGNDVQIFAERTDDLNPHSQGANGAMLSAAEVTSLTSTTPLEGFTFYLVDENNAVIGSATTDSTGHAFLSTTQTGYASVANEWACTQQGHWPVYNGDQIVGGGETYICLPIQKPEEQAMLLRLQ